MIHVGDIMSTVEGYNLLLFEYLHSTEHPHSIRNHDIPYGNQIY